MSAHADDLRYFYSHVIGRSQSMTIGEAGSTKNDEPLEPGRYLVRVLDLSDGGRIWLKQGPHADVEAAVGAPCFPMDAGKLEIVITVRPGPSGTGESRVSLWDGIAAIAEAGDSATLVVTKISRDKR